jgi:hypothetical protein
MPSKDLSILEGKRGKSKHLTKVLELKGGEAILGNQFLDPLEEDKDRR